MRFSNKAILGTVLYLIVYQVLITSMIYYFVDYKELLYISQIIFATSTSLGAVFWSLFLTKKYEKYSNFENVVSMVYEDLEQFRGHLAGFGKLMETLNIKEMFKEDTPKKSKEEIVSKYTFDD